MGSTRLTVGLCIVMFVGAAAAVPGAVAGQQDQVTITATIVDQDGQSVGGGIDVTATWDGGIRNATTASNGQVLLDVPRGATVSLGIDDDRYVRNVPYVVDDAAEQSVDVPVSQSATAEITVRNTDNESVDGARVLLYRNSRFITDQRTDADGTVTTPPVEAGNYRLDILRSGYYTNRTQVTVTGTETVNRTIEEGEVLLTVSVADDYFEPPESINASVRIPSLATLQTGANGEATTTVSVNTEYDVVVTRDGYDRVERTVDVNERDTTVNVSLDRTDAIAIDAQNQSVIGQPVTLEVTDEYGEPVANATVTRDGDTVGMTDTDGELRVTPESAGTVNYTVDDGTAQATVTIDVFDPNAQPTEGTSTADSGDAGPSVGFGPGFTPVTVLAALVVLSLLAYRRR